MGGRWRLSCSTRWSTSWRTSPLATALPYPETSLPLASSAPPPIVPPNLSNPPPPRPPSLPLLAHVTSARDLGLEGQVPAGREEEAKAAGLVAVLGEVQDKLLAGAGIAAIDVDKVPHRSHPSSHPCPRALSLSPPRLPSSSPSFLLLPSSMLLLLPSLPRPPFPLCPSSPCLVPLPLESGDQTGGVAGGEAKAAAGGRQGQHDAGGWGRGEGGESAGAGGAVDGGAGGDDARVRRALPDSLLLCLHPPRFHCALPPTLLSSKPTRQSCLHARVQGFGFRVCGSGAQCLVMRWRRERRVARGAFVRRRA